MAKRDFFLPAQVIQFFDFSRAEFFSWQISDNAFIVFGAIQFETDNTIRNIIKRIVCIEERIIYVTRA